MILGLTQAVIAVEDTATPVAQVNAEDLEQSGTTDVSELVPVTPAQNTEDNAGLYIAVNAGAVVPADADVKYKGSGGSGSAELSYDNGFLLEGAIGYAFADSIRGCLSFLSRIELGLSYYTYDWDKWREGGIDYDESKNSTSFLNFMLNGYWDIDNNSRFTPFVMGGVGFSVTEIDHQDKKHDETVFAGQLGGGVSFEIMPSLLLDATYRFHFSEDLEFKSGGDTTEIENQQHQFLLGARWQF